MADRSDDLAYGNDYSNRQPNTGGAQTPSSSSLFGKITGAVKEIGNEIARNLEGEPSSHVHNKAGSSQNRYGSFVSQKDGNDVKWYVDGCGYFYAVSRALESATESIWILDWWLSPELYLRRPPSQNEQYRLDRMLQAAAERGVKVSIIVYKEVTQALTRKYLSPTLPDYLHSMLPLSTDPFTSTLVRFGLMATAASLEYVEETNPLIASPLTVSSAHTKHELEALHPNIAVYRHPDHLPDAQTFTSSIESTLQNLRLDAASISKLSGDALKSLYGITDDVVLYWAHHEKLCLIDGRIAFMGGLDLCFGRWDTNQHSIADVHPADVDATVFPGQDYNNARIADFNDVANWDQNKVDRTKASRMGWSDISISLHGPCVEDLRGHFVGRWNFVYDEKYNVQQDKRYYKLDQGTDQPSDGRVSADTHHIMQHLQNLSKQFSPQPGNVACQLVRSCTKWSNGTPTEHSIQNAYIDIINKSQHFIYIENQFFITATSSAQKPVENLIGKAIAERILRAARAGQKYKVLVNIPSVPGFAGDLKDDSALGTRAIMEFQYHAINRGHGHSIMELIAKEGFDPQNYIRFYNLRNYDRINAAGVLKQIEEQSGVDYESARMEHDDRMGAGYGGQGETPGPSGSGPTSQYEQYQRAADPANQAKQRWDSVAECYMLNGEDIRSVPWVGPGDLSEIDAFVSEELYIHTKVLIADDRVVLCGSANLNDRSQLGTHDSEIALVIEDPSHIDSTMNGQPWKASRFAASLRRQLFRKHLGLLKPQDMTKPDSNFEPVGVPNEYDWGSPEDQLVEDPISDRFQQLWNGRAKTNTEIFRNVFHSVPDDTVRTWKDYQKFWEYYFHEADEEADGKEGTKKPARYEWGHVVRELFPPGDEGVKQVKEQLSKVRGSLVEMPLNFLKDEDIAKTGASLNALTEPIYT